MVFSLLMTSAPTNLSPQRVLDDPSSPNGKRRMRRSTWVVVVLLGTGAALWGGFAFKNLCTTHAWDGYQFKSTCFSDVYQLYTTRGLNVQPMPYVHGDGTLVKGSDVGDLEYPVVTGYYAGLIAAISHDATQFFHRTAIGLALCALVAALLLLAMARDRRRVLLFALAPTLVLYAFHNWDLLAVAAMVGGLYAFHRRADRTAGVLLGLGAAAKVFPGLLIPALMLARYKEQPEGRRRVSWGMFGWASGVFVAVNLPIMLINFRAWLLPWRFQSVRFPNYETWSYFAFYNIRSAASRAFWHHEYSRMTSLAAAAAFIVAAVLMLRREARRPIVRPYVVSFRLLLLFLITGKIFSPQYMLWVLPFFVLLELPWYSYVAFAVSDASVWFAISNFFYHRQGNAHAPVALLIVELTTFARYAALAWLFVLAGRHPENIDDVATIVRGGDHIVPLDDVSTPRA
jgi:hypothetical protein